MNPLPAFAPLTTRLCVVLLVAVLLSVFLPGYDEALALSPCDGIAWARAHTVLTHAFVFGGLLHGLASCAALLPPAMICERFLGRAGLFTLWCLATATGAVVYLMTADNCTPFVGPSAAVWALSGAAVAVTAFRWRMSHWLAKAYAVAVVLVLPTLLLESTASALLGFTGWCVGVAMAIWMRRSGRLDAVASAAGIR